MYIVFIVGFLVGIIFLFRMRVNEFKGEHAFETYLEELAKDGEIFQDVFLDNQTIAKYVYISTKGIFNIYYNAEMLGRIYGDDEESTWKQVMEHRKLPIPNPVRLMEKQRREFEEISCVLGKQVAIHDLICISKRAIPKLTISIEVCSLEETVSRVQAKEDTITADEVTLLSDRIRSMISEDEDEA